MVRVHISVLLLSICEVLIICYRYSPVHSETLRGYTLYTLQSAGHVYNLSMPKTSSNQSTNVVTRVDILEVRLVLCVDIPKVRLVMCLDILNVRLVMCLDIQC